jgi:hypothetical protein
VQAVWHYRQRVISDADVVFIRRLIAEHPQASRRELSYKLCEAWNWVQANGAQQLPPVRLRPPNMSLIHTCELNGANPFDYLIRPHSITETRGGDSGEPVCVDAVELPRGTENRMRHRCVAANFRECFYKLAERTPHVET